MKKIGQTNFGFETNCWSETWKFEFKIFFRSNKISGLKTLGPNKILCLEKVLSKNILGQKRRKVKAKKVQYARVGEDWGEDEEIDRFVLPPPPVIGRRGDGDNHVVLRNRNSTVITEYFSPKPKRCRMERCDGDDWSEEEWFLGATQQYVDTRSSP